MSDYADLIARLRRLEGHKLIGRAAADAIESLRAQLAAVLADYYGAKLEHTLALDELAAVRAQLAEAREYLSDFCCEMYWYASRKKDLASSVPDKSSTWADMLLEEITEARAFLAKHKE